MQSLAEERKAMHSQAQGSFVKLRPSCGPTAEDRLLYTCARQCLDASQIERIQSLMATKLDWHYILRIARAHAVAPLVYRHIAEISGGSVRPKPIPQDVVSCFERDIARNIAVKMRRSEGLRRLLALGNANGLGVMVIKGAALDALVYEKSWYTTSGDVDLLIRQRIEELDTAQRIEIGQLCARYRFECDSFRHEDFLILENRDFELLWRNARRLSTDIGDALFMSVEDLLVTACLNSCKHKFFRLKNIVDIVEILRRCPKARWAIVAGDARLMHCSNIVYAALRVAHRTVGIDGLPAHLAEALGVHPMRAMLIDTAIQWLSTLRLSTLRGLSAWRKNRYPISVVLPYLCYHRSHVWRRVCVGSNGSAAGVERF
jgi:hypothetical protein